MPARRILALAVAAATLGACGASPSDAARATVQRFAQAARDHDYHALCTEVLAPTLVEHLTANNLNCEQVMAQQLSSVRDPTVSVGKVTVQGSTAAVIALTVAKGEPSAIDTFHLVRTGGWRIASMTSL